MNDLQVFKFENKETRVVIKDGEPWFVAKDVAEALGYVWEGTKSIKHVPEEWRGVYSVYTPSGNQNMAILSEQGLYFFLGRSDKPLALPFQKLVAGEILPALRKTGTYTVPGREAEDPLAEWKKNFPYPFLLLDDAAVKMREMRLAMNKGACSVAEWRRVVLGDFGSYKPCTDIINFANENLTITGILSDYVRATDLYGRYQFQDKNSLSRNKFTRQLKKAFPTLVYQQKKIDGYPVLVFCGCKLKSNLKEAVNA